MSGMKMLRMNMKKPSGNSVHFSLKKKNARRIYTFISEKDIYSLELCQNIKMRQEGHFIEFTPLEENTEYVPDYDNIYLYAMLQREWQ